jgi:hypothetical protein
VTKKKVTAFLAQDHDELLRAVPRITTRLKDYRWYRRSSRRDIGRDA